MPGQWETFYRRVWRRRSFVALSEDARLIYLWSWTNERANLAGLYPASPHDIARALTDEPVPLERLQAAMVELAQRPLVLYDDDRQVLWVVGRVQHALKSRAQAAEMRVDFEACPPSPLRRMFFEEYRQTLDLAQHGGG